MRGAAAAQAALDRKLGLIEAHHKEIHDALASMEGAAARAYAAETPALDGDGRARDALYGRAAALGAALARCGDDLRSAIADVNAGALAGGEVVGGEEGGGHGEAGASDTALVLSGRGGGAGSAPSPGWPAAPSSASHQLGKLVRVLNSQLQAMADLDERCDVLEGRLGALPGGGGGGGGGGRGGGEGGGPGGEDRQGRGLGLF